MGALVAAVKARKPKETITELLKAQNFSQTEKNDALLAAVDWAKTTDNISANDEVSLELVKLLLEHGAEINHHPVLYVAASNTLTKTSLFLLERGADYSNITNYTNFSSAVKKALAKSQAQQNREDEQKAFANDTLAMYRLGMRSLAAAKIRSTFATQADTKTETKTDAEVEAKSGLNYSDQNFNAGINWLIKALEASYLSPKMSNPDHLSLNTIANQLMAAVGIVEKTKGVFVLDEQMLNEPDNLSTILIAIYALQVLWQRDANCCDDKTHLVEEKVNNLEKLISNSAISEALKKSTLSKATQDQFFNGYRHRIQRLSTPTKVDDFDIFNESLPFAEAALCPDFVLRLTAKLHQSRANLVLTIPQYQNAYQAFKDYLVNKLDGRLTHNNFFLIELIQVLQSIQSAILAKEDIFAEEKEILSKIDADIARLNKQLPHINLPTIVTEQPKKPATEQKTGVSLTDLAKKYSDILNNKDLPPTETVTAYCKLAILQSSFVDKNQPGFSDYQKGLKAFFENKENLAFFLKEKPADARLLLLVPTLYFKEKNYKKAYELSLELYLAMSAKNLALATEALRVITRIKSDTATILAAYEFCKSSTPTVESKECLTEQGFLAAKCEREYGIKLSDLTESDLENLKKVCNSATEVMLNSRKDSAAPDAKTENLKKQFFRLDVDINFLKENIIEILLLLDKKIITDPNQQFIVFGNLMALLPHTSDDEQYEIIESHLMRLRVINPYLNKLYHGSMAYMSSNATNLELLPAINFFYYAAKSPDLYIRFTAQIGQSRACLELIPPQCTAAYAAIQNTLANIDSITEPFFREQFIAILRTIQNNLTKTQNELTATVQSALKKLDPNHLNTALFSLTENELRPSINLVTLCEDYKNTIAIKLSKKGPFNISPRRLDVAVETFVALVALQPLLTDPTSPAFEHFQAGLIIAQNETQCVDALFKQIQSECSSKLGLDQNIQTLLALPRLLLQQKNYDQALKYYNELYTRAEKHKIHIFQREIIGDLIPYKENILPIARNLAPSIFKHMDTTPVAAMPGGLGLKPMSQRGASSSGATIGGASASSEASKGDAKTAPAELKL